MNKFRICTFGIESEDVSGRGFYRVSCGLDGFTSFCPSLNTACGFLFLQGSSVVERRTHYPEVAGSIPAPAPIFLE